MAVKSIAKSEAHPSPQALITHYPLTQMHHWFTMAQWPVRRMRAYLEACEGPTPVAEALRQRYLAVLRESERLWQVSLAPDMQEQLDGEEAALQHDLYKPVRRKGRVRTPTGAVAD